MEGSLERISSPHVKVVGDAQAVAVSGKVVPLVHVNPIPLVGHNLARGISL